MNVTDRFYLRTNISGLAPILAEDLLVSQGAVVGTTLNVALKNVSPSTVYLGGVHEELLAGETGSLSEVVNASNNHLGLNVTVLAGSGIATITGDSISEASAVPTLNDTEEVVVDSLAYYQTDKKWLNVSDVTFSAGITGITYSVHKLGYVDALNHNFQMVGYRIEGIPTNASSGSLQLLLTKVKDLGDKKTELVTLEDITLAGSTPFIKDLVRAGGDDRSYTVANQFEIGIPAVLKQTDFIDYFGEEATMYGGDGASGLIVSLVWANMDYADLTLYSKNI